MHTWLMDLNTSKSGVIVALVATIRVIPFCLEVHFKCLHFLVLIHEKIRITFPCVVLITFEFNLGHFFIAFGSKGYSFKKIWCN